MPVSAPACLGMAFLCRMPSVLCLLTLRGQLVKLLGRKRAVWFLLFHKAYWSFLVESALTKAPSLHRKLEPRILDYNT